MHGREQQQQGRERHRQARRSRQHATGHGRSSAGPPPAPFAAILKAVEEGHDVNEVEAAGNTPLHFCCYEGWVEG